MVVAIDIIIAIIVAFCVWRGYKNGIIRGICGVLALIISIFAASLVATAYSDEFTGMLKPFVGGMVDSVVSDVLSEEEDTVQYSQELSDEDLPADGMHLLAYSAMRELGLPPKAAETVAKLAAEDVDGSVVELSDNIAEKLSSVLAYTAVFGVCFALAAILFAVIGSLINRVFSLPGLEWLDSLLGAIFGLAKGLIIVYVIALVVRYIGLLASETIEETVLLKYLVNINPIAGILGI